MLKGLISKFQKPQSAQLPGYGVLGVLCQGSQSMIFKAREQATGRIVAVKVQKPAARKAGDRPDVAHLALTEGQVVAVHHARIPGRDALRRAGVRGGGVPRDVDEGG